MKHFFMPDWVDFARGVKDEEPTLAMQRHLDEGCAKCLKNLEIWRHVMKFAEKEGLYAPLESSVRMVEASFVVRQGMSPGTENFDLPMLVFDSSQVTTAAAGV